MGDVGAATKQFQAAPDGRSLNEIASERVGAGGNGQSLPQFGQPLVAPNVYQPHFPQAAMTAAAGLQQPNMLPGGTYPQQMNMSPAGTYPQQTMMMGQPPPGAHMGVFRPPPPSQSFVSQPPPLNYAGQLPPHIAAALLQQMQQEASRRPPAFVDPTASPFVAPTRMAHPTTATAAQPPSDDPFRSEHGRGNGVITFYVSADWSG
jgi:hypothetical protein